MKHTTLDILYEVRDYFIKQMPEENTKERELLDMLDSLVDEFEVEE